MRPASRRPRAAQDRAQKSSASPPSWDHLIDHATPAASRITMQPLTAPPSTPKRVHKSCAECRRRKQKARLSFPGISVCAFLTHAVHPLGTRRTMLQLRQAMAAGAVHLPDYPKGYRASQSTISPCFPGEGTQDTRAATSNRLDAESSRRNPQLDQLPADLANRAD